MKTAKEYRLLAVQKNAKYTSTLAVAMLLVYLMEIVLGALDWFWVGSVISSLITTIFVGPIIYGGIIMIQKANNNEKVEVIDLFSSFKDGAIFFRMFVTYLLKEIFIFLWTLLLIIPGIIKSYSYSMAMFIATDNPSLSEYESIGASKEMMFGHKWKLFTLELSYIGWFILCIFTLGILTLWVMPKFGQAKYQFYLDIKNLKQNNLKPEEIVLNGEKVEINNK